MRFPSPTKILCLFLGWRFVLRAAGDGELPHGKGAVVLDLVIFGK